MYHFATIITPDYLPFAEVLRDSLKRSTPASDSFTLHVLLTAGSRSASSAKPRNAGNIQLHHLGELQDPMALRMRKKYAKASADSFRWALKPVFAKHLLLKEAETICLVDCDINFFGDYRFIFDELKHCSVLLTPHWKPYTWPGSCKTIGYEEHFQYGIFNAGFIGASRAAMPELNWWARACMFNCVKDIGHGFFVDQTHLNLMQVYFEDVRILRHQGCNVAHWNEKEVRRSKDAKGTLWLNRKWPLVFAHFALPGPDRYMKGADPMLRPFFEAYFKALREYGFRDYARLFSEPDHSLPWYVKDLRQARCATVGVVSLPNAKWPVSLAKAVRIRLTRLPPPVSESCSNELIRKLDAFIVLVSKDSLDKDDMTFLKTAGIPVYFVPSREQGSQVHAREYAAVRLARKFKELASQGFRRIALYGGGAHTVKIIDAPIRRHSVRIECIIDDDPAKRGQKICGTPVFSAEDARRIAWDAILISSDTIEDKLYQRARSVFPHGRIERLYGKTRAGNEPAPSQHARRQSRLKAHHE